MTRTKAAKKGQTTTNTETRTGTVQPPKTQDEVLVELASKVKENAEKSEKYIQLNEQLKKVGPGLTLLGLQRVYSLPDRSDFVY